MIPRLPTIKLADLKKGDAVMIVASEPSPGSSTVDRDHTSFRGRTDSDREPEWRHEPVDEHGRRGRR